jgi:pyruvate ferredoxin oxidoreductase alpha subunit
MSQRVAMTGNEAAANALRQVNPDVAAVYPITPQTELMHKFSGFVADGEVRTEVILVESEHSAMSATIGASAAGARAITATAANGLALMWEVVYIAASMRLPVVMPVVNRALSGPINIHCDHSDTMGCRDSGWIQIYSENAQEAYDNTIQAFRIAEHPDVLLPVMATYDGFIISHTTETLDVLEDEEVAKFVGEYEPAYSLLDPANPITMGPLALPGFYYEQKRMQVEAMDNAREVIPQIAEEYRKLSGRGFVFLEEYLMDDAEVAILVLGSCAGTAKEAADEMRQEGVKAGIVKLRCFRPFPGQEVLEALKGVKVLGVMDRSISFGLEGGPVFNEVRSAAFGKPDILLTGYIYGLGGRDVNVGHVKGVFQDLVKVKESGKVESVMNYVGLREEETYPEQELVCVRKE